MPVLPLMVGDSDPVGLALAVEFELRNGGDGFLLAVVPNVPVLIDVFWD